MAEPIAQFVVAEAGTVPGLMPFASDMKGPISDVPFREVSIS